MAFHIVTGIYGQDFWKHTIGSFIPSIVSSSLPVQIPSILLNLPIGQAFVYIYSAVLIFAALYAYFVTLWKAKG